MSEFECPRCGHCCSQSVHSCSNECDRPACVNVRKAVEREREACLQQIGILVEAEREACEALYAHEDVQAPVGNSAWGEAYQDGWIAGAQAYRDAIRARGKE